MKALSCAAARRRLQAYHDNELPIGDQIAVDGHLDACEACRTAIGELAALRSMLRIASPGRAVVGALSREESFGFQASVVSRIGAEHQRSLSARMRALFDDMHFVYAGMGGAASTLACPTQISPVKRSSPPFSRAPRRAFTWAMKFWWMTACSRFSRSTSSGRSGRNGSSRLLSLPAV